MSSKDLAKKIEEANFPKVKIDDLFHIVSNRFLLSSGISKRARQIADGVRPTVDFYADEPFDPIAIAMKEVLTGNIVIDVREEVDNELEMLQEMDNSLNESIENSLVEETPKKDKKPKSKQLIS